MATFYQPGFNEVHDLTSCEVGGYKIFCNTILPASRRLAKWYQSLTLVLAVTTIAVPLLLYLVYRLSPSWKREAAAVVIPPTDSSHLSGSRATSLTYVLQEYRQFSSSLFSLTSVRNRSLPGGLTSRKDDEVSLSSATTLKGSLRNVKSFRVVSDFDYNYIVSQGDMESNSVDVVLFPTIMQARDTDEHLLFGGSSSTGISDRGASSRSSFTVNATAPEQMKLGYVDIESLGQEALSDTVINLTAAGLLERHAGFDITGFALRCSSTTPPEDVDRLIRILYDRGAFCILLVDHDSETLITIDITNAAGIIIENASILPTGEPRDYFQARPLRNTMIRCMRQREKHPEFFIGYMDRWLNRPHPSVVKRAVKLAEHYGAVFEHGPMHHFPDVPGVGGGVTIGGFEYLRRPEVVDLQRSWLSDSLAVALGPVAGSVWRLPVADLELVVPGIAECLLEHPLRPELAQVRNEVAVVIPPQDYLAAYPSRSSFWSTDEDGKPLASQGCYPLGSEPDMNLYAAIAEEQAHLRQLGMLHVVEGSEQQFLLGSLRSLADHSTVSIASIAVERLIHGIDTRDVCVYKGLATGFRSPDSNTRFWGISTTRDANEPTAIDIFISQSCPNDASVVLHTWLAHHGHDRAKCIEHELALESLTGFSHSSGLPMSVRVALEDSSPAERLLMLQRIHVSGLDAPFAAPMQEFLCDLLIEQTTKATWSALVARKALDGSMPMVEILGRRLEYHARNGATHLPRLQDVVRMSNMVDRAIVDALFNGQHRVLSQLVKALLQVYTRHPVSSGTVRHVDVAADMFALAFFTSLRRAAFEDVYIESTDRCPIFLSQPDQAAVFSELWTLGSQCENYFGTVPRDIGDIIYRRRTQQLAALGSPTAADRVGNEIMTMYASTDEAPPTNKEVILKMLAESSTAATLAPSDWLQVWRMRFAAASAMSIFCAPTIIDVVLLTFVGRGLFLTAYMDPAFAQAGGYAVLIALLLTAGVTGWVGSVGSHYLPHYAYDNLILFHVQRLSGGIVLAAVASVLGGLGFGFTVSVGAAFVFVAYLMCVSTYFNLLGIMSTMHQHGSPLPSGRNCFLKTFPILFVGPLVSSVVNGHDLEIYLPVIFGHLLITMFRYRQLCHQWSTWMDSIPAFKYTDMIEWYTTRPVDSEKDDTDLDTDARDAFESAVRAFNRRGPSTAMNDPLVAKVTKGLPFIDWLLKKTVVDMPKVFSTAWFTALDEAIQSQRQLSRGLKDHSVFVLFRLARHNIAQNLGLFLVALLDRWVMIVMSHRKPYPSVYLDSRSRYAFCFCILYFCLCSMALDATLFKYWAVRDSLSEEKLVDFSHAQQVARTSERLRKECLCKALVDVMSKVLVIFGALTLLFWIFVDRKESTILFYLYMFGYTCCVIFQFNRCFTTNVATHVKIIICSAALGFIVGILLHALPWTAGFLYNDVLVMALAAFMAATGTSLWTYRDWKAAPSPLCSPPPLNVNDPVFVQPRLMTAGTDNVPKCRSELPESFAIPTLWSSDGTSTSDLVVKTLCRTLSGELKVWHSTA